jgi:hypothetical protein
LLSSEHFASRNHNKTTMNNDDDDALGTNSPTHAARKVDDINDGHGNIDSDSSVDDMENGDYAKDGLIDILREDKAKNEEMTQQEQRMTSGHVATAVALLLPHHPDESGPSTEKANSRHLLNHQSTSNASKLAAKLAEDTTLSDSTTPTTLTRRPRLNYLSSNPGAVSIFFSNFGIVSTAVGLSPPPRPTTRTITLDPSCHTDLDADVTILDQDFFVAEMIPRGEDQEQILIVDGVKSGGDPKVVRIFQLFAFLVIATTCTILLAKVLTPATKFMSAGSVAETPVPNMTRTPGGGNMTQTIGDAWADLAPGGIETFSTENGSLDIFLELVGRTDKNFSFFSASKTASLMRGMSYSIIQKALLPEWNGHVVSSLL